MNYFTMYDADQFSFIRVPKELMINEKYRLMSAESKLLYGLLLDRVSLSRKNNWVDNRGRVFIIFTRTEISEIMVCGEKKITKLFNELKEKDLIEEKRQGLQKPNLIYVGKFLENSAQNDKNEQLLTNNQDSCNYLQKRQNDGSGYVKMTALDPSKRRVNNTDNNNTNISNTDILISQSKKTETKTDGLNEFEQAELYFDSAVFDELRERSPNNRIIEEIKLNVLDMYFAPATMINGERKCQELVRAALMRLKPLHIDNVMFKFKGVSGEISSKKAYIQAMLYNEALEANLFIQNQVSTDMANWKD